MTSQYTFTRVFALFMACACAWLVTAPAFAQSGGGPAADGPQAAAPGTAVQLIDNDDPAVLDPSEPDFVVVNVPTTLRLPRFKTNFRMTHRFAGNLRRGSFSENAGNLFGLDQGAIIGFELRVGLMRNLQAGVFRTNFDKTIQMSAQYDGVRQRGAMPVSISVIASIEGTDNFRKKFAPAVGLVLSRKVAGRLALYAAPVWVGNTNASLEPILHQHGPGEEDEHEESTFDRRSTVLLGLGARARLTSTLYLVGELTPRLGGYAPDEVEYGFGLEKRVGGHAFALTFTNTFGTTFAQMARGGTASSLYMGFNLGRKFY